MQESNARCSDCEYYEGLITSTNQKLAQLRKPLGTLSLPDSVASLNADDMLANPEKYEQSHTEEEKLQHSLKIFTLALTHHQRSTHRASA
jgi:hypothetical protein